jgi:PTS system cellobiose-specific IIA component
LNGIELIAFQIISNVGMAKSKFIEALEYAKKSNYEAANECIKEGNTFLVEGHNVHRELIQKEASGEKTEFSILLMHAEDQFMSTETIKLLVGEMIEMRREFSQPK